MNKKVLTREVGNLIKWMKMPQKEVLDKFASLEEAIDYGEGDNRFVYVPGDREDRVVLVAHSDTVWGDIDLSIKFKNGIFYSRKKKIGIGADDRAGCALLWKLRKLGHSLLITSAEEDGCVGTSFLMFQTEFGDIINNSHQFAVQFDRCDNRDLVFYDVSTEEFEEYCEKSTGYTTDMGAFTDISVLCDPMCGVNLSVGYDFEHTQKEYLSLRDWINTLNVTRSWLSNNNLPRFEHNNIKSMVDYDWMHMIPSQYYRDTPDMEEVYERDFITCPACYNTMEKQELLSNDCMCDNPACMEDLNILYHAQ